MDQCLGGFITEWIMCWNVKCDDDNVNQWSVMMIEWITGSVLLKGLGCSWLCSLSLPGCKKGPCPPAVFPSCNRPKQGIKMTKNENLWMMRLSKSFLVYVGYIISSQGTCQTLGGYTGEFHSNECWHSPRRHSNLERICAQLWSFKPMKQRW